jgi:hypothetical protein
MFDAFWLPPQCGLEPEVRVETIERGDRSIAVRWPIFSAQDITQLAGYLRAQRRRVLQQRSVESIVDVLDAVAAQWLDRDHTTRQSAVDAIATLTGFSEPMVAHAIELEQVSSRRADLLAALDNELGDHRALDGFTASPKGRSHAVGPGLIGGIFSANIPALPHLTVMRALLVKAACLGRVSQGEPLYLPLYVESLAAVDPDLASCLAVVYFSAEQRAHQDAFLGAIDHLIAYGSDATIRTLQAALPSEVGATWHGHRMGFCYVTRDALTNSESAQTLADAIAYDFTVFDQHACLAPQACFVQEGGAMSPSDFADALARGMDTWLDRLPPRSLTVDEAAGLRAAQDEARMVAMAGDSTRIATPTDRLQGTVVVGPMDAFVPSPLDRFARVVPVANTDALMNYLTPVRRYLQCAVVAGGPDENTDALKQRLAGLGVTRICPPGSMGTPSMVWHHDGRACLADLVRWCDEETVPPGEER